MKKVISLFVVVFTLFSASLPAESIRAVALAPEMQDHSIHHLHEKKAVLKQKRKDISKIEAQINKKNKQIAAEYKLLFKDNMTPNDQKIAEIEVREDEIARIAEKLVNLEKAISKQEKQLNINMKQKNHHNALLNCDKLISLLDKKHDLLKVHLGTLQSYIDFLQSINLK